MYYYDKKWCFKNKIKVIMQTSQIILLILAAFIAYLIIKRYLQTRSINQYSPAEAEAKMRNSLNIVFLDVRMKQEKKTGSIKGSIHIPLHELRAKTGELERYRGKEIICYCKSGRRSLSAASILKGKGFNASSLQGGIGSWNLYKSNSR
jgi:rhodanese-related sulfurtransferase